MADDLAGVDLKLQRAKFYLAHLKNSIAARCDPNRYRFALKRDPESGKHILTAHNVPEVDPQWRLEVGEILFNLRSALDHLPWQLVILGGSEPGEHTSFPIRETPFSEKGKLTAPRLDPEITNAQSAQILKALDEIQPYYGPDGEPADPCYSPLWQVNKLNNIDKHRLLLVVLVALDVGQMWWGEKASGGAPDFGLYGDPVTEGSPVAWFDFHGEEPPPEFDPHPALHVRLSEPVVPWVISMTDIIGYLKMVCD